MAASQQHQIAAGGNQPIEDIRATAFPAGSATSRKKNQSKVRVALAGVMTGPIWAWKIATMSACYRTGAPPAQVLAVQVVAARTPAVSV